MINTETVYQKVRRLNAFQLQEVTDFMDFLLQKNINGEAPKRPLPKRYRLRPCRRLGAKLPNLDNIADVLAYAEGDDYR